MTAKIAAVVVGAELNGLGVARSLALGGVPVTILGTHPGQAGLWSRHAKPVLVNTFAGRCLVDRLVQLAAGLPERPVLLLTDEFAVHSVSEARAALAPFYRFRLPRNDDVKMLADKALFQQFAHTHDLPVPRTLVIQSAGDIDGLARLSFPAVVKPADKRDTLAGRVSRAVKVEGLDEAATASLAILQANGCAIVQEWINGPESNIFFTMFYRGGKGEPVMLFTGRKILCHPRDTGSTAACIAAPLQRAELEARTLEFAALANFEGLGSMEYKWDSQRGAFLMVEPTVGRTDWQEEIATLCGANIPLAVWRHETGLPPAQPAPLRADMVWCSSRNQRPREVLLPFGARVHDGYFRWGDPGPAVAYYVFDRLPKRMRGSWLPQPSPRSQTARQ